MTSSNTSRPDFTTKPSSRRLWPWLVQGGPRWAALLVLLLALGFYVATAAPGLTVAFGGSDGAELAVAVHTLGIPHPTGYPTYVLLAQVTRTPVWEALSGQVDALFALGLWNQRLLPCAGWSAPAAALSRFSALCAALTVGLVALAAAELFAGEEPRFPALVAALTAGLTLATAGLFWSQAVIAEVYTLHTLLVALAAWLLLRWRRRGGAYLPLAGLTLGLGLGNHVSLAFGVAGAVAFLVVRPVRPGFFLIRAHRRPTRRELLWTLLAFLAGLLVYLYVPLRAATDPWLNWGDPRTLAAFWEHLSGAAYRHYLFQVPLEQILGRLSAVANLLLRDFVPRGVLLGLAGAITLGRRDRATLLLLGIPGGLGLLLALTYGGADSYVHLLPLYVGWALAAGLAAGMAAVLLRTRWGGRVALLALLLPLLGAPLFLRGWSTWNLRQNQSPPPGNTTALRALPSAGIMLTNLDEETFALWYWQIVEGIRPDNPVVDVRLLEWSWYREQLPSRYPGLAIGQVEEESWLRTLLEANAGRPAFTLGPVALPEGYSLRNGPILFEVVPPPPLSPPC